MATKTFKIGLSNTDKQNMAQDVYERLLALTFPEYDTTTSYDVGDFVVYNDQLYKCIGATSGAWDSSKWQLATLNDLLTDIEDAVAFVNDKANVDGNYPTMTVGVADQLSPYDDESGDDQDEPFSFQATGTGNGTQPDFSTGAIALMKEKRGNTVCYNQLSQDINATNWQGSDATATFSDGVATFTATAQNGKVEPVSAKRPYFINGHKYLMVASIKLTTGTTDVHLNTGFVNIDTTSNTNWQALYAIQQWNTTSGYWPYPRIVDGRSSDWDAVQTKKIICIDLTQWFNGDIPQDLLDNPENFFRYYQGSLTYNAGTLVNANGRYVKCIGRQQWDEEWEEGTLSWADGSNYAYSGEIRSKNYIRVIPNGCVYFKSPSGHPLAIFFYDKDKNFIRAGENSDMWTWESSYSLSMKMPANCCYVRFFTYDSYGSTYNHDITISLYYEGESGYDQYYPYEELTNNDTGTEVLRSAGSVHDIKLPSGEIKRNVDVVNLKTLSWQLHDFVPHLFTAWQSLNNALLPADNYTIIRTATVSLYSLYNWSYVENNNMQIAVSSDGSIRIRDDSCDTVEQLVAKLQNVYLNYGLSEPITEQGTPYSENLVIDDFGSMDFSGTNGVPQGNLIFYPVDYKAFIDTMYNYTDGTPSNLALKSDLASDKSELQGVDTQLLNAIGGTLRQCLCVKETLDFDNTAFVDLGSLSWGKTSVFYTVFNQMSGEKGICSNFVVKTQNDDTNGTLQIRQSDKNIYFLYSGTEYENMTADQFKNSLKGVLFAYEKAQ